MRKPLKPNEIRKVVEHEGFVFKKVHGSHWHYKKEGVGKVTIPQYGEIGEDIFMWICRQMKVSKESFWKIYDQINKREIKYDPKLDEDEKIWNSLKKDVKKIRGEIYDKYYKGKKRRKMG